MTGRQIVLVAYQCGPDMGSVSQIGWEWYVRLAKKHQVTLVTHVRNRPALAAAGVPVCGSNVMYIDTEWFAGPLYRLAKKIFPKSEHSVFLVSSLDYFLFDLVAWGRLRRAIRSGKHRWEIIHRVTPVTLAASTWLGRLGLPLIVGPLNSGLEDPAGFGKVMRAEVTWLARCLRKLGTLADTAIGSTRSVSRLLVASNATYQNVATPYLERCTRMIENGVDLQNFAARPWPADPDQQNPLQVLFVGRLIPAKALDLLLAAIAIAVGWGLPIRLKVIGDGPMRREWEACASRLGLDAIVDFAGSRSMPEVARAMQDCHVFCLPSVRESGGAVLLEAMACARPVIAMNYGGPAEIVDHEVGALVPMTHPEQAGHDMAALLAQIFENPRVWANRGRTARQRVEALYSWNAKISSASELYAEVLDERNPTCI